VKTETYERLRSLYEKHGSREFGKLCQKFLAIAFQAAGYRHIEERGVQGVDFDAAKERKEKYAVEVKTTVANSISFEQKDVEGLKKRKKDGYQPVLAVLRLHRFSHWILADADSIKSGNVYIDSLRVHRLLHLEECIAPLFDRTLEEHFDGAMREAQGYLDKALRQRVMR
jgi:Holliday junction resolvase